MDVLSERACWSDEIQNAAGTRRAKWQQERLLPTFGLFKSRAARRACKSDKPPAGMQER